MGLGITAYSHLKPVGQHEKDPDRNEGEPGGLTDWCYYDNHVEAFTYDTFPRSFRGVPVLGTGIGLDGEKILVGGCYETTDKTETHQFEAGSYTGYNVWRDDLQAQFNPRRDPDGPFYELIWFADNEGTIGPDAAADLLDDCRIYGRRYVPLPDWPDRLPNWTRACELAAAGGLIRFH